MLFDLGIIDGVDRNIFGPVVHDSFHGSFLSQLFSTRHQIESLVMIRSIETADGIAPFQVISVS